VTAGSSELEKVGSIFLQVNPLHQRAQVAERLRDELRPGVREGLAVRAAGGKRELGGTGSAAVPLPQC